MWAIVRITIGRWWFCACLAAPLLAGCAVESQPLGRRGKNLDITLGRHAKTKPVAAPSALPAAMPPAEPRAGSNLEPAATTSAASAPLAADKQALGDVIEQIQALGETSPEEQARLIEDLKSTDPAVWPMLAQYSRVAAARRRAEQGDPEPIAAAPRRGSAFATERTAMARPSAAQRATNQQVASQQQQPTAPSAAPAELTAQHPWLAAMPGFGQPSAAARPDLLPAQIPGAMPAAATPAIAVAAAPTVADPAAATPLVSTPGVVQASAVAPIASAPASGVVTAAYAAPLAATGQDFKAQLGAAIAALEQQAATGQAVDPQREAQLRMLYLLAGRKDDALRPIAGLPETQQSFWANELFGLAAVLDAERQPDLARRAAEAATHLDQARARLRESGALTVRNIAFCTEVRSYGIVKPFESHEFAPGQEVLLYAEVENFKSESTPEGYHTALKSSYEVLDSEGRRVAQHEFPLTEEHCKNVRRDFFIRYFLRLPEKPTGEGKHTLRLSIEDTLGQKTGQATIDFTFKRP